MEVVHSLQMPTLDKLGLRWPITLQIDVITKHHSGALVHKPQTLNSLNPKVGGFPMGKWRGLCGTNKTHT